LCRCTGILVYPVIRCRLFERFLHWLNEDDQDNITSEVRRVLDPGDRFVAGFGGKGNVARVPERIDDALAKCGITMESTWYFPSVAEYTNRLERYGFEIRMARLFDRPTRLEDGDAGLRNWLDLFGDDFFAGLSGDERETVLDDIKDHLRSDPHDGDI